QEPRREHARWERGQLGSGEGHRRGLGYEIAACAGGGDERDDDCEENELARPTSTVGRATHCGGRLRQGGSRPWRGGYRAPAGSDEPAGAARVRPVGRKMRQPTSGVVALS